MARFTCSFSYSRTIKMMRRLALFLLLFVALGAGAGRHYTVIVSLDGFRWDYPLMYDTPFLDSLGREGVRAVMRPSFPSKTFPNHYTLATGLVPDHHGIIANRFYDVASGRTYSIGDTLTAKDPSFYGGEPVWITAGRQGLKAGVVYWPGSDVAIQGRYPDYWQDYARQPRLSFPERVAEVERLMKLPEGERPQLVMAYFEYPDYQGHDHGPASVEVRAAVEGLDRLLGMLYGDLRKLPYGADINFIVTSDHGMAQTSPERIVCLSDYLEDGWCERVLPDLPALVFPAKGHEDDIMKALDGVPHIRAWRKKDVPAYLNYGTDRNIAPIVVLPDEGWTVSENGKVNPGSHGYDPTSPQMNVIFRAAGPDFKRGYVKSGTFDNTAVYPTLCRLLGIEPAQCDGKVAADLLAE